MIKRIASCPYCRQGEVAYDCETMDVVINPDGAGREPCEHLVCLEGFYCRASVLPDGTNQAGFAKVHWQHPDLLAADPDAVYQQLQERVSLADDGPRPPAELPCRLDAVNWEVTQGLSRAEVARWLDEVGWDRAGEVEEPYQQCRLRGWIGFARWPAELIAALGAG